MTGNDSYFIIGIQSAWDECVVTASMKQFIYEFVSNSLVNDSPPIIPTRFTGNASPMSQIQNFLRAGGAIPMHLHAGNMLPLLQQIFNDDTVGSTDFTAQEVFGDGLGAGKAIPASPFSLDTQPTATDPVSSPGKLILTLDVADAGVVTITGTDQNDTAISEVVTFDAVATMTTTKYFKSVDASGIAYTGLTVAATLLITADRNTYTHVIEIKDTLLPGLSMEVVKGTYPSTYVGVMLNSGVLEVGDQMNLTINCLAQRGWNGYKVPAAGTTPTASATGTDVSGYARISQTVFPAFGLAMSIGGTPVPINSMSFNFNNNLDYPRRFRNVRTEVQPTRQGKREITLTVGIDYADNTYDVKMLENIDVETVVLYGYSKPYAGPEYSFSFSLPRCQIGASVDPPVTDYPEIIQTLQLRPIRTVGATGSDEVTATIIALEAAV